MNTAPGAAEPSPPLSVMEIPDVEYIVPPPGSDTGPYARPASPASPASPKMFKKHRVLPHPRNGMLNESVLITPDSRRSSSGSGSQRYTQVPSSDFFLYGDGSSSHVASIHTLRHQRRKLSGVELPPTPPAHSRTSSSSHSASLSNLSPLQTPAQSSEDVQSTTSPSTPPNQRSPPTPEVTPPRTDGRHKAPSSRPSLSHRIPSKSTTITESRSESFRTALESPEPSDEEDSRSTLRPAPPSARTSQTTVLQLDGGEKKRQSEIAIGLGVEPDPLEGHVDLTPRTRSEFDRFDGDWRSGSEVQQEWDDNLSRLVTVRRRRTKTHVNEQKPQPADDRSVSPTNATKTARVFPLQGRILTYDSREPNRRSFTAPEAAAFEVPTNSDARRLSGMSSKSAASTIVEAILVETPPRRQKTLRHVKRVDALRDSIWQPSPSPHSSAPSLQEAGSRRRHVSRPQEGIRDSYASNSTANSISSHKARREVRKSGGIPVVVIPDRQSSNRSSSQERSLQSASSLVSKRSHSIASVPPPQVPSDHDVTSYFDRPPRRGRRVSEPDGSAPGDQRTIDIPPPIPRRTSSMSASTGRSGSREASRHGSRRGSLTAESLKAHDDSAVSESTVHASGHAAVAQADIPTEPAMPVVRVSSVPSDDQSQPREGAGEAEDERRKTMDTPLSSPHLSTKATPFSQISVETAAEISQALAVSIVPHQNRSVLMVDHRPSDSSDGDHRSQDTSRQHLPTITTTDLGENYEVGPATPERENPLPLSHVDSPLRNPRVPPEPPVLAFIPATPSGLTPADERPRLLGNFYEETQQPAEEPARPLAMLRRALTGRRNSYGPSASRDARPNFLTRKLSLGRNLRKDAADRSEAEQNCDEFSDEDDEGGPEDASRLYPDWQPSYHYRHDGHDDSVFDPEDEEMTMRYPPIDNRPKPRKRSLSQRMKRTFAILPLQDDHDEFINDKETERRTIRRTPSGNLRVVKHRGSVGSLRNQKHRPATSPESRRTPIFPRLYDPSKRRQSDRDSDTESQFSGLRRKWSFTQGVPAVTRRFSEKRREKRSNELRQKISGPRDVRDGVNDVIRGNTLGEAYRQQRRGSKGADF